MTHEQAGIAASTYAEQEIASEGPLSRVARLYEMAVLEVTRARANLSAGHSAAKGNAVRRALSCLSLLQSSLNMKEGGEVARNLDRLYTYMLRRLSEAHLSDDESAFAEVAGHLSELASAWREVARRGDRPAGPVAREAALAAVAR